MMHQGNPLKELQVVFFCTWRWKGKVEITAHGSLQAARKCRHNRHTYDGVPLDAFMIFESARRLV
jgi:hypothetical protein